MRRSLMWTATLGALVAAPATARATNPPITQTVHCGIHPSLIPGYMGGTYDLRIKMRSRRVDGYMPRCSVANFVLWRATEVRNNGTPFYVGGASWVIGNYRCRSSEHPVKGRDELITVTRCTHRGRYSNTVWFDGHA